MYIFVGMLIVFIAGFLYLSRNKEKVDNSIADQVRQEIRDGVSKEIKIYHISDLHYLSARLTDYKKSFEDKVEYFDAKSVRYVREIFDCFVQECINTKPDLVVFSGDLTFNGERLSHIDLRDKLMVLRSNKIPVVVIPGNHDIDNEISCSFFGDQDQEVDNVSIDEFVNIYRDFGYGDSSRVISRDKHSLSYLYRLSPGVSLLMLDTNTGKNKKYICNSTYRWIENALISAHKRNERVIGVSHQNILAHNKMFVSGYKIDNSSKLVDLYNKYNVRLNLSGHMHSQHLAEYKNVYDAAVSCLSLYPNQYSVISIGLRGDMSYETMRLDIEKWAQLYSKPDKNLLNFKNYSREFIVRATKNQTDRVIKNIEIDEEEKYKMMNFMVDTSIAYFSGRMLEHPELNIKSDGYRLWQKYCDKTFLASYLESIYSEEPKDHNKFDIRS